MCEAGSPLVDWDTSQGSFFIRTFFTLIIAGYRSHLVIGTEYDPINLSGLYYSTNRTDMT